MHAFRTYIFAKAQRGLSAVVDLVVLTVTDWCQRHSPYLESFTAPSPRWRRCSMICHALIRCEPCVFSTWRLYSTPSTTSCYYFYLSDSLVCWRAGVVPVVSVRQNVPCDVQRLHVVHRLHQLLSPARVSAGSAAVRRVHSGPRIYCGEANDTQLYLHCRCVDVASATA